MACHFESPFVVSPTVSRCIALMLRNSVSRLYPPCLHLRRSFSSRSVSFQVTPNTTLIMFTDTPKLRHYVPQSIRLGWYKSRDPNKCQRHPLDPLVHDRDISMATESPAQPEHEPITTAGCQKTDRKPTCCCCRWGRPDPRKGLHRK
jgi:hypothetical protein